MRRFEDEKMRYRPPLLEEPCAQTLSGKSRSYLGNDQQHQNHNLPWTTSASRTQWHLELLLCSSWCSVSPGLQCSQILRWLFGRFDHPGHPRCWSISLAIVDVTKLLQHLRHEVSASLCSTMFGPWWILWWIWLFLVLDKWSNVSNVDLPRSA